MKKITCKKVKELIQDENKGSKEYKKYGLKNLAKDESNHASYLKNIKGRICR